MLLGVLRKDQHARVAIIAERHEGWGNMLLGRWKNEGNATSEVWNMGKVKVLGSYFSIHRAPYT